MMLIGYEAAQPRLQSCGRPARLEYDGREERRGMERSVGREPSVCVKSNGRKTLGPLATAFDGGEEHNPTRRILAIPVKQGDTPGGSVNDTFPIISSTSIDGNGCRVVETSDTNQNNPSTNQPGGSGEQSQVIDDTISDNPLPNTGGPSLPGLAVIALGLAVLGGATVVGTGVRRRG